jgi:hypothetical protein
MRRWVWKFRVSPAHPNGYLFPLPGVGSTPDKQLAGAGQSANCLIGPVDDPFPPHEMLLGKQQFA